MTIFEVILPHRQRSRVPSREASKEAGFQGREVSKVPSIKAGKEAQNLGIWANTCEFRAAEII